MSISLPIGFSPTGCLLVGLAAMLLAPAGLLAEDVKVDKVLTPSATPVTGVDPVSGVDSVSGVERMRSDLGDSDDPTRVQPVEGVSDQAAGSNQALLDQAMLELSLFSPRLLRNFYMARDFHDAWNPSRAASMLELAQGSVAHGLDPRDFNADAIRALLAEAVLDADHESSASDHWRAELILSDALLRYLHHLQYGKHNPKAINPNWTFVDSVDAAALQAEMQAVLAADDLAQAVDQILPDVPFYEQLKLGYERYLALNERLQPEGGWAPIASGPNLKIGMRDPRLARIRDQLALLDGYAFSPTADPTLYDQALYDALREFQGRSGLAQDGVIGPRTLAALNHPLEDRLASIRANLERMRWLYNDLPDDYLFVDIAAYQLELVRDHQPVWQTRVVVGTGENQTPMFRDKMEHLVFNPTWSVPRSIQKKMRGVPADYKVIDRRTGRRVYPSNPTDHRRYRLVQQPGPRNALGRVKFMFPNGHAIYLHDTPSRHLFARSRRSYSHGCVRVQEPLDLAREVLAKQNWDISEIQRVVDSGRTRYVNLDEHLPVLLYYLTARADEQGRVGFRQDLYERDASLFAALESPSEADRLVFKEPPAAESEVDRALSAPASQVADHLAADLSLEIKAEAAADTQDSPLLDKPAALSYQRPAPDQTWWGLLIDAELDQQPISLSWQTDMPGEDGLQTSPLDLRPAQIRAAAPDG